MLRACQIASALVVLILSAGSSGSEARQGVTAPPEADLPPISWTCPMHPDVVESTAGGCPICKMNLVAVRLDSVWTCPVHSVITARSAGTCPIDRRELVRMTVSWSWTCPDRPEVSEISPGKCPDGTPMQARYTPRPHGNHNPQHGGQFFMAPDNWHHLEGTLPRAGVVQIYLYDDYTQPLPADQVRLVRGRVVTKEIFDAATRTTRELSVHPLALASDGRYLSATVDSKSLPAQMTAKIKFKDEGPEYRFDFAFTAFSKDPKPAVPSPARPGGSAPDAASTPPAAPDAGTLESARAADPLTAADSTQLAPPSLPETVEGMVAELKTYLAQIKQLIDDGAFLEVWVPAFKAKDLALAVEAHSGQLSDAQRDIAAPAIRRLVQTAWLLDGFGDLGNREQIQDAYGRFASAVAEVERLVPRAR